MKGIFEDFEIELQNLKPEVRQKAFELAEQLMKKEGYNQRRAIDEAVQEAEAWFLDLEG